MVAVQCGDGGGDGLRCEGSRALDGSNCRWSEMKAGFRVAHRISAGDNSAKDLMSEIVQLATRLRSAHNKCVAPRALNKSAPATRFRLHRRHARVIALATLNHPSSPSPCPDANSAIVIHDSPSGTAISVEQTHRPMGAKSSRRDLPRQLPSWNSSLVPDVTDCWGYLGLSVQQLQPLSYPTPSQRPPNALPTMILQGKSASPTLLS